MINKISKIILGVLALFLIIILFISSENVGSIFLLITGILALIASVFLANDVKKLNNSLLSKILSVVLIDTTLYSVSLLFYGLGNIGVGDKGLLFVFTLLSYLILLVISIIIGTILVVRNKENIYQENPNKILASILFLVLIIFSYATMVPGMARISQSPGFCSMHIEMKDDSFIFRKGGRDYCLSGVAEQKLDVSICKKISDSQTKTGCYTAVALSKNDSSICGKGADEGIQRMDLCLSMVTEKTGIVSPEDLVMAVDKICESADGCPFLPNMETLVFNILNNPNDTKLTYAIKATKHMWREGQGTRVIPLLRNLLTTASLENRKISMDSLLYRTTLMDFETEKQELKQILPLIKNQPGLSNYAEQVRRRLSAQLLTPTQTGTGIPTQIPTNPR